ncbi:hypothetical protein KM043_014042 [Ampulex compressa]|nr:hypothetical protein KM043_014042 [Ampulex compressa]
MNARLAHFKMHQIVRNSVDIDEMEGFVDHTRDLEYTYGWNRYTLNFLGIWPEERRLSRISSYQILVPVLTMLCFASIPQTVNLIYIWGDFDMIVENISMGNMTISISVLKIIAFWFHGKSLKRLLKLMARDWEITTNIRDRRTMLRLAKLTRNTSIRSTIMAFSVIVTYTMFRCLMIKRIGRHLLFRAYFPYDAETTPRYELTFFMQLFATVSTGTSYAAIDTFVAMLVLHVCGQLSNLRYKLTNLRARTREELRRSLADIVKKHEYLNWFADTVEDCFSPMLLLQMLGCTVQLCCQSFQAFISILGEAEELSRFQFAFLLLYVLYITLQLYLYCYVGERLLMESTKIAFAAYDCEWYNLSAREAKSLLIIMCRARSPLRITAGGFCSFTLQIFTEVLKKSMGYMSVLYAVRKKTFD